MMNMWYYLPKGIVEDKLLLICIFPFSRTSVQIRIAVSGESRAAAWLPQDDDVWLGKEWETTGLG